MAQTVGAGQSRAVVSADAGREIVVDVAGVDARGPEGVALQVQRLGALAAPVQAHTTIHR